MGRCVHAAVKFFFVRSAHELGVVVFYGENFFQVVGCVRELGCVTCGYCSCAYSSQLIFLRECYF